jgi:hypothetical protein
MILRGVLSMQNTLPKPKRYSVGDGINIINTDHRFDNRCIHLCDAILRPPYPDPDQLVSSITNFPN